MSWMCNGAHPDTFERNHSNSQLFQTRVFASIWISTPGFVESCGLVAFDGEGLLRICDENFGAVVDKLFTSGLNNAREFPPSSAILSARGCSEIRRSISSCITIPIHGGT